MYKIAGNILLKISFGNMLHAGFMLNLENLQNKPFLEKKSGKTWNSQGIFYNFYPSQGEKISQHAIFINYWHGYIQSPCSDDC